MTRTPGTYAILETSQGTMVCRLFEKEAPLTVENFVGLAEGTKEFTDPKTGKKTKRPFFDGLSFHRVIPDFMIQGGCPLGNGTGGPGYKFPDEFHKSLRHDKAGKLSMANAGPGTNGSQFFVTVAATPWLDNKHTISWRSDRGRGCPGEDFQAAARLGRPPAHARGARTCSYRARLVRFRHAERKPTLPALE